MGLKFNIGDHVWWAKEGDFPQYVEITDVDLARPSHAEQPYLVYRLKTLPGECNITELPREERLFETAVEAWDCLIEELETKANEEMQQYLKTKERIESFHRMREEDAGK